MDFPSKPGTPNAIRLSHSIMSDHEVYLITRLALLFFWSFCFGCIGSHHCWALCEERSGQKICARNGGNWSFGCWWSLCRQFLFFHFFISCMDHFCCYYYPYDWSLLIVLVVTTMIVIQITMMLIIFCKYILFKLKHILSISHWNLRRSKAETWLQGHGMTDREKQLDRATGHA